MIEPNVKATLFVEVRHDMNRQVLVQERMVYVTVECLQTCFVHDARTQTNMALCPLYV